MRPKPPRSRSIGLSIALALASLTPLPASAAVDPQPGKDFDPANAPFEKAALPAPPTEEERLPVIDLSDLSGIWPDDVVPAFPGTRDPASPDSALAGTEPLPKEGSANVDVFATSEGTEHIAMVEAQAENEEDTEGNWLDVDVALQPSAAGWTWTDPSGNKFTFPSGLSTSTPVLVETAGGSLAFAPEPSIGPADPAVTPAASGSATGTVDGATVTYAAAVAGGDLSYTASPTGVQEIVTFEKAPAETSFRFILQPKGLKIQPNDTGGMNLIGPDGALIGSIPAAVAYDASPEAASATASYELKDLGDGTSELTSVFDAAYFAKATYPVIVDPAPVQQLSASRDAYVDSAFPSTSYESNIYLKVNSGQRTYMRFLVSSVMQADRLVYDASFMLYPTATGGVTGGIGAYRDLAPLPTGSLTWNNKPLIGTNPFDTTFGSAQGNNGWWSWQLKELFQHLIDPTDFWNLHWPNDGFALTASNPKTFHATESTLAGSDPVLFLMYNDLPNNPLLESPPGPFVAETDAPTLKVTQIPSDSNGDDVMVSFQISDDGVNWTGNHLVFQSPYDDKRTFTVPSGIMVDGQDYWWRAVSRDVCQAPAGLCTLTDGAGTVHTPNASNSRKITVSLKHHGDDPRYAMWSHDVGSGMTLKVNEANGNLFLDVPFDSYATPVGRLDLGLTYNSQVASNYGLGSGWDVAVGPESGQVRLPVALYKLDTAADADVKIRFRGGRVLYFPHVEKNIYGGTSANSGWLRKSPTNWNYVDGDGGRFTFSLGAENAEGAHLLKAKPSVSQDTSSTKSIDYAFTGTQLTSVTDPLGRKIVLTWDAGGKLTQIVASGAGSMTSFGGQTWTLGYDASSRLSSVSTVVTIPGSPNRTETVGFSYGANGKLSEVRDGVTNAAPATGWSITYAADPSGLLRVSAITAPGGGSPSSPPTPWLFNYHGPYKGTTAAGACITDPRGTGTECDAETVLDPDFQTQVEFSWAGLPIEVVSPKDDAGVRHTTTYVFDNHLNLLCERSPVANAWGGKHCTSATDGNGNYTDLDPDGFSTRYTYYSQAPYRLKTVKQPAATAGAPRLQEAYTYDAGATFTGLWAEIYPVNNLADLPNDEYTWNDFDQDWGTGGFPGTGGSDNFSVRLSGWMDVADWNGQTKTAKFRIWSNDGVSLSVDGKNLLDCFGTSQVATNYNCGTNADVKKTITPPGSGLVPFEIEYSELIGSAQLTLNWDGGDGGAFNVPLGSRFQPNLGLVTTKTYQKVDAQTTDLSEETWTYPGDLKARRLPEVHARRDLPAGSPEYKTFTAYNSNGQPTTITENYQTALAATTTNVWMNGTPAWDSQGKVSCLKQTTDPTGAVTNFECNRAGDTTLRSVVVRAAATQLGQTRDTIYAYDSLGRPVSVTGPSGEETITSYDLAGRVKQTKVEIENNVFAQTDIVYDDAGHAMTETLPDPDRTGPLPRPTISHSWNWVDLETSRIDVRGKQWQTSYDALSRPTLRITPLGARTTTTYSLGGGNTPTNREVVQAPSGAKTTSDFDVLGRTTAEALYPYLPTTTTYDVTNKPLRVTDPAGTQTKTDFNDLGELTTRTEFSQAQPADQAITTYTYDAAGRLAQVDGPRSTPDDRITYGYDLAGRMITAQYEGVTLPSSPTKASVTVTYDDAGERVRVAQPLTTTTTMTRDWTYDVSGRPASYSDARGTTTYGTNLAGWVTQVSDPRPQTVFVGYDDLGRPVCRHTVLCTQSTAGAETYSFDAAGNMTQAKNPNVTFDFTYDDDGRLWKAFRNGSPTPETTYTYQTSTAQLTSITDAAGTTAFTYNSADQILTIDDPFVTGTPVSTYAYDSSSGRLLSRTDAQANLRWDWTYETATGRIDTQTIKNNTSGATLASFDLGYDSAGNVSSKNSSVFSNPANGSWSYFYDGASRLTQAIGPNASGASTIYDYAYDGGGNRILAKETTGSVVKNLSTTYDATGLPTSATDAVSGEAVTYTHDAVGNLKQIDSTISMNDWTYAYDAFSRLTCAVQGTDCGSGSTRVLFTLDGLDRALSRTKGSSTTSLTYQGNSESVAQVVTGTATTLYSHAVGDVPVAEKTGSTSSFYLRDPHGDVVGLASTGAANLGTSTFDPYGRVLAVGGATSLLGYQGDMTDADTKQVDMGTRWYGPGLGRFTSRDVRFGEVTSPMTLNQHVYAGLNPITMWDPTGMGECSQVHECASTTPSGGIIAVGGNPGAQDNPYNDAGSSVTTFTSAAGIEVAPAPDPPEPHPDTVDGAPRRDSASGSLVDLLGCIADILGCGANQAETGVAIAWAENHGASCAYRSDLEVWICTGAVGAIPGDHPAFAVGNVIVTELAPNEVTDELIKHELVHIEQSHALGIQFIPQYILASAVSAFFSGGDTGSCNVFELQADAIGGDTGYECHPSNVFQWSQAGTLLAPI